MRNTPTSKHTIINTASITGIIPVVGLAEMTALLQLVRISYRFGIRVIEFKHQRDFRGLRLFSWLREETRNLHDLALGVGTVLDANMAQRYIQAGADFITSPFLQNEMGVVCQRNETPWMPGCSTMQDVEQASALGAEAINLLSGNILGPEFLRQVSDRFPHIMVLPSSGVEVVENNLRGWFDAGAICVRLGDSLFPKEAIAVRDWIKVETKVYGCLTMINRIREEKTISVF